MASTAPTFINSAERCYSFVRMISLDVAAAALGGGVLAVQVTRSAPRPGFYWLLPGGVWVVYTIDHLLDARRMGPLARTPRHRFHYQHAGALWAAVAAMSVICGVGGWVGLSWPGLFYAAFMCLLVAVHELIVKLAGSRASPLLVKELGVAAVFSIGVWGMPWLRHRVDTGHWLEWPVVLFAQYLLLAVVNLIEFAIYEVKTDAADGQTSFVRGIGRRRATRIVVALLIVQLPLGFLAVWILPTVLVCETEAIYLVMTIGLWFIIARPAFVARSERYRTIGDGVFLLPLLMAINVFG